MLYCGLVGRAAGSEQNPRMLCCGPDSLNRLAAKTPPTNGPSRGEVPGRCVQRAAQRRAGPCRATAPRDVSRLAVPGTRRYHLCMRRASRTQPALLLRSALLGVSGEGGWRDGFRIGSRRRHDQVERPPRVRWLVNLSVRNPRITAFATCTWILDECWKPKDRPKTSMPSEVAFPAASVDLRWIRSAGPKRRDVGSLAA